MDSNQLIMNHFPEEASWEQRYKKIILLGKKLPKFPEENKIKDFLINGCQAQLWLKAEFQNGKVILSGDSDGLITKGLLALMLEYCSNKTPQEILDLDFAFIEKLNLSQYLTARRTNGLQSLIDQIRNYAKAFYLLNSQ